MGKFVASELQKVTFINEIAPLVVNAYNLLGKVKPSVCIGMACLESGFGWGTDGSRLMYKNNAVLGQKVGSGKTATKYWGGKAFSSKTSEEYQVGVHTNITALFRKYDNLQMCFYNYYELLNTSLYKKVLATSDFKEQMQQIKQCGYMTSSTEVNSVLKIISRYNLTRFDGEQAGPVEEITEGYVKGKVYTLDANLYIRNAPNGEKIDWFSITTNAQLNAKVDEENHSILLKGTRVTCKNIKKMHDEVWMQIPSGYVCAKQGSKTYIK